MSEFDDSDLERRLSNALGPPPVADFEAWRRRHGDAVDHLNPGAAGINRRRRRRLVRMAAAAAAAVIVAVAAVWAFSSQQRTFAQTIDAIVQAETITWTISSYDRVSSVDGERTWLRAAPRWERSYLAPSTWRDVRYDEDGSIASVAIEDVAAGKVLHLNMKTREAMLKNEPSGQFGVGNPFAGLAKILQSQSIEFAGQRTVDGARVNVFRLRREFPHGDVESMEIWLDKETKQLVGYATTPGDDFFDPATAADRDNPAEEQFSKITNAGVLNRHIVFNAQLDRSLFSLTPPEGFTIVEPPERPKITEELMIQWLGLSAKANGGMFLELERGFNIPWHKAIALKPEADRTAAEQEYMTVTYRHMLEGNRLPVEEFANEFTEPGSFRYLGKGVTLGSGDQLVCFYKLKSTRAYRAVYGDLRIADVDPQELPLPVD